MQKIEPTKHNNINNLLSDLLRQIQRALGNKLLGLYLYGSLASGDFDKKFSDIDLLAVTKSTITSKELKTLKITHADFAKRHKNWNDRIEVQYFSVSGLNKFKSRTSKMANISPGEPLHMVKANLDWLMNWYFVQENGIVLFGPLPKFIPHISKIEFLDSVKKHALQWKDYAVNTKNSRGYQAYAILTMCRAVYTLKHKKQTSKIKSAAWFQKEFSQWANLIKKALKWRKSSRNSIMNHKLTYPETEKFIGFTTRLIRR